MATTLSRRIAPLTGRAHATGWRLTPDELAALRRHGALFRSNRTKLARTILNQRPEADRPGGLELTQTLMSSALRLSQAHLSAIERGAANRLVLDTAQRFATFYGCSVEDLFPTPRPMRAAR